MRRLLPLLGICVLIAAACTAAASPVPSSSIPAGATASPRYAVATGPDKLILRIAVSGGFVAPGYLLTEVPLFALYGDGRVIVPGPIAAIYPSPLLPNLRVMRVTPAEIQKIVAAADAAGLLGPDASFDIVGIADAGTTVFTAVVDGKVHRISAYALSEAGADQPGSVGGHVGGGVGDLPTADPAIAAARARLSQFWSRISDLSSFLGRTIGEDEAYEPSGMRLFVRDAGPADPAQPSGQVVAWPLATDPMTTGGRTAVEGTVCLAVTGTDLTKFLAAAAQATGATVWTSGSARYAIGVRPLYPNESGCAGSAL
jgi:hypothetical protein